MGTTRQGLTRQTIYTRKLFLEIPQLLFFNRFMGIPMGTNKGLTDVAPMGVVIDVTAGSAGKQQGETYEYKYQPLPNERFLPSGTQLDNNEFRTKAYSDSMTIKEMIMGVLNDSILDRLTTDLDISEHDYKTLLTAGAVALDYEYFDALNYSPTTTLYVTSGVLAAHSTNATAKAAVTATDKIRPEFFTQIKPMLTTGFNGVQSPIQPIMVSGEELWHVIITSDVEADMKLDPTWHQAMKDAQVRGETNPLFIGAIAKWDKFVFYVNDKLETGVNSNSAPWSQCIILGANALAQAFPMTPTIEQKNVAYSKQSQGWGYFSVGGIKKIQFTKAGGTAKDYGCVHFVVANSQYSSITIA
jgi:hypothetical protein